MNGRCQNNGNDGLENNCKEWGTLEKTYRTVRDALGYEWILSIKWNIIFKSRISV